MKKITPCKLGLIACGLVTGVSSAAAVAQDSPLVLEEVIVTATKRSQNLSEVPIAISVFTADELQQRGVSEISQLAEVSSSLSIVTGTAETTGTEVRIRGIGTSGNNPGLEASVGIFVDGIYRSRSGLGTGDLLDIQTVEVLRGPQGTLFGRNTSAGAISVQTKKPDFEWGGYLAGELENYGGYRTTGGISGPLVDDKLAFRLSATAHQRDGYIDDRLTSWQTHDRDRLTINGQMLWLPTDDLELRLIVDSRNKDEHCCAPDYSTAGPTAPAIEALGGIVVNDPFAYKSQSTFISEDQLDELGVSLELNWSLSDSLTLSYLGSYRDSEAYVNLDPDTSNIDLIKGTDWDQDNENLSHELRLQGFTGRVDWLFGAYYYREDTVVDWSLLYGADFGNYFNMITGGVVPPFLFPEGAGDQSRYFSQQAKGWALFTHNIIELSENYDLVLGLRWSQDTKDAHSVITNDAIHCAIAPFIPFCPVAGFDESRSENEPTGTVKLVRNLGLGNVYASYARGYKSGGFNLDRDASTTGQQFEPELVDSFELGAKWIADSGVLQLNSALFYSKFQDFQLNEFDGTSFSITNAGEVSSKGLELEVFWLPTAHWTINLGTTYADTVFDKHPGFNNEGESLEGMQLPYAPTWAAAGAISYQTDIGRFTGNSTLSANYMGKHNTNANLDPQTEVDSRTLVNAHMGLASPGGSWELSIWANNVLGEEYLTQVFNTPLQDGSWSAFRGEPRTYGAAVKYSF